MREVRILESDANKRGDLFGKLIGDLFFALGYEDLRFTIHKSGRELDIVGIHRAESRKVIAECKATSEKIGGADVNKFIGSVNAEQAQDKGQLISAYFVSFSGFTETAIEQERQIKPPRVVLFDAPRTIAELEKGSMVCSEHEAVLRSGQSSTLLPQLRFADKVEMLAHQLGWIWCLYFEQHKNITHFALIHADGQPLGIEPARFIVESDASVGGPLARLTYLEPPPLLGSRASLEAAARKRYFEYLAADFGEIELTGLPADQDVGSRRLQLENLFIPLHLVPIPSWQTSREIKSLATDESIAGSFLRGAIRGAISGRLILKRDTTPFDDSPLHGGLKGNVGWVGSLLQPNDDYYYISDTGVLMDEHQNNQRQPLGYILSKASRLAILAPPGGGKSTLLKRLAIAYAFPDRFRSINDGLPERPFFPIILRCRQLGELATASVIEVTRSISKLAEMPEELSQAFVFLVGEAFRTGTALLLVDGLDELSDERMRLSFVRQLRIFASLYPKVSLVVTSREAGFRAVAGALSTCCVPYEIAELDDQDISLLTLAWHKEVVGDRAEVVADAKTLAEAICDTERVRDLARNPLLLTTLLLVKRWIGQLPTRRTVLYGKAIEVLLMTWNVEGHDPLDLEEVIPQLAYLAFIMMKEGVQRVTSRRLQALLSAAREQMPEVLSFAKLSVSEFVDRVELRSSLLIQNGHDIEDGILSPVYEFRHLTFQEYLTAVAVVEGYYPNRTEQDTVLTPLEPHLQDERWREIIPVAAVLSGRRVQPLIQRLVELAERAHDGPLNPRYVHPAILLGECIADECSVVPSLLARALNIVARRSQLSATIIPRLLSSKYTNMFEDVVREAFTSATDDLFALADAFVSISIFRMRIENLSDLDRLSQIERLLTSSDVLAQSLGALMVMRSAFEVSTGHLKFEQRDRALASLGDTLTSVLMSTETHLQFSVAWALTWLANSKCWSPVRDPGVLRRLVELWVYPESREVRYVAAWALSRLPLLRVVPEPLGLPKEMLIRHIKRIGPSAKSPLEAHDFACSCVVGYYLNAPWPMSELERRFEQAYGFIPAANLFANIAPSA